MRAKVVFGGLGVAGLLAVIVLPLYCDSRRENAYLRDDAVWQASTARWDALVSLHTCLASIDRRSDAGNDFTIDKLDPRAPDNHASELVGATANPETCAAQLAPMRAELSGDAAGSFDALSDATKRWNAAATALHDYFAMHQWRDDNYAAGAKLFADLLRADAALRAAATSAHHTLEPAAIASIQAIADDHEHRFGRDASWWGIAVGIRIAQLRIDLASARAANARDLGRSVAQRDVKALYELTKSGPPELYKELRSSSYLDALYAAESTTDPSRDDDYIETWRWHAGAGSLEPFGPAPTAPETDN